MSNNIDQTDTEPMVNTAEVEAFLSWLPEGYYPLEGYRKGWRDRMQGLEMYSRPWDAVGTKNKRFANCYYEDYVRGYHAAQIHIEECERDILENRGIQSWI